MEIIEEIKLPSPFGRVILDEMHEISERLDKGNRTLGEMNIKLDKLYKLDALDGINTKLDTLPERIAKALR